MSFRAQQKKKKVAGSSSASTSLASSYTHAFSVAQVTRKPEDEEMPTFVDRVSKDGRRTHRQQIDIQPCSPVKRARLHALANEIPTPPAPPERFVFSYQPYDVGEALRDNLDDDDDAPTRRPKPKALPKAVTPADKSLHDWVPLKRDAFVSEFTRHFGWGDADRERCPGCSQIIDEETGLKKNTGTPEYRCRDCFGGVVYCRECITSRHSENPLHRVYHWRDDFFVKIPLAELGLRIQLGHPPHERCSAPERAKTGFVTLHTNGIHEVTVDFCGCEHANAAGSPDIQLLRMGWFPATHDRPHTAATFAVLDQFQQETCQAKVTMYDFYGVLEKLTNNVGIKPPDRYREWLRLCREYEHCLLLLYGGRSCAFDPAGAAGTKSGELAVDCPACPDPEVNLVGDWENAPRDKDHIFTLYLALDACFRLKRRLISSEMRDPALGSGWAYMVENGPYREYLRTVTDQKEMNTCSGLAALDYANTKFSRGYATTGVGMCVCARHEFVQPNGVGDLQRGERFANIDYIFGSVTRHKHPRLRKLVSYDIVCIWMKTLKKRMAELPALVRLTVILELFKFVIPKMHIHAHTLACQLLYSLNLILGSAQTDGEGVERPWANIGGVASSTCDMAPGARAGVLDFQWSAWNWAKLVGIVATLRRRMDKAVVELARQEEIFAEFSQEQADRVPEWKQKVHDFEQDPKEKNPYEIKVKGLTESEVRLQLTQEEAQRADSGIPTVHDVSPGKFICIGLDLEDEQRRIRVQAALKKANTTEMQIDLGTMRTKLSRRIAQFRKLQQTYTPASLQVLGEMSIPEDQTVENMPLVLPSALSPAARSIGCLAGLSHVESRMRNAQCGSALASLRNHLHIKSRLLIYRQIHVRHQGANTRSRTIVARNEGKIGLHSEKYQMAWNAIRVLGDGDPSKVGWQVLNKDDIRCMEDTEDLVKKAERKARQDAKRRRWTAELKAHGLLPAEMDQEMEVDEEEERLRVPENRREVSWIWTVAGAEGTDAGFEEALRIEWSKAYARVRRWREEVELLRAEYERVKLSFAHAANEWEARAQAVPMVWAAAEADGAVAFARRQAYMFRDLIVRGETTWTEEKLARGKKRARGPRAIASSFGHVGGGEGEQEEEEERRRREEEERDEEREAARQEEEEELARGQIDPDDEEYIFSGAVED
ncbi:hypothetical protein B0H16DRAFT_1745106 [Mycena metata]|uniref:CxC2-like cysteine cluster KDZ transposase-associated domain-containing protein n=1 Tax=Mycena metata TaxID=1033252 RepID=A0AAD7H488_9AGAR|nr:hypothetical protein B0H16DRAFT_1745106 [Mycena metata]